MRVLIASHSHPGITRGGAETAAFHLFRGLNARPDWEAWFLGCDRSAEGGQPGVVLGQPFSDREYVYHTAGFDWFKFANPDPRFRAAIERLFRELEPDVVHFHHYINFGVEIFQHLRRVRPECRIILTLHEYLALCHHYGQMVTREHHLLCYQSSPEGCQRCFPEFSRSDFFLRSRYISRFLDLVDVFVAPSRFLAERYVSWGLPREKMVVLENLTPPSDGEPVTTTPPMDGRLRVGFFGQISPLKGIDMVFDAAARLAAEGCSAVQFDIFGDYHGQPPEFQARFLNRLATRESSVRFNGPYDHHRVDRLMRSVDVVLVPSLWWENSPLVIQEALRNRRPVICSDIGGMAEKVRDGIDGFHFPVGNVAALAALLRRLAEDRKPLTTLTFRLAGQPALTANIEDYIALYRGSLPAGG